MNKTLFLIAKSWTAHSSFYTTEELLDWIRLRNQTVEVEIRRIGLNESSHWYYDEKEGRIRNRNGGFFSITGCRQVSEEGTVITQPIILQPEIGYLGIICREINGVMHFLMQAKIEPGNVNKIQISPTIQATKSNFTQLHRGAKPAYLDYFMNASAYEIVVDQIQSEQSSRFYQKRNRNIILRVEEDIPVLPTHRWMTLRQIKTLMRYDNLVNMDTRTVLSCIPYCELQLSGEEREKLAPDFKNQALFRSVFERAEVNLLPGIYRYINNYKMFHAPQKTELIPLHQLEGWVMREDEITCCSPHPFSVIFCDISIEGREVREWTQPLFAAKGIATFGLLCCEKNGRVHFVVRAQPEIGCLDVLELGPTIQREAVDLKGEDSIERFFMERLRSNQGVIFDQLLSEEGGRFYHEQNRNVLLCVTEQDLPPLPEGYFLVDYQTLNQLVQINNILNIQLRNLLSLWEA